jgi:hypothetical protein
MLVDTEKYEGQIAICCDSKMGIYGSHSFLKGKKTERLASRVSTEMSGHGLLTLAVIAVLRSVSRKAQAAMLRDTKQRVPRIQIVTDNTIFAAAFAARIQKKQTPTTPALRIGKNFDILLNRILKNFTIDVVMIPAGDRQIGDLRNWAVRSLDTRNYVGVESVLLPSAIAHIDRPQSQTQVRV